MPLFEGAAQDSTAAADHQDNLAEAFVHPRTNLARGIVWADILADIAADEEARRLGDAA